MGRKNTPRSLKILRGNPGRRPIPDEPNFPKIQNRPAILDDPRNHYAAQEWDRVLPILEKFDVIRETDSMALLAYCMDFQIWRTALDNIEKEGITTLGHRGIVANPATRIAAEARSSMRKFMQEFGLTPASRSKVSYTDPEDGKDDAVESFLNGRKKSQN